MHSKVAEWIDIKVKSGAKWLEVMSNRNRFLYGKKFQTVLQEKLKFIGGEFPNIFPQNRGKDNGRTLYYAVLMNES